MQLLSSCITYRDQLHRINLFGRFLEIFDDLPMTDYNRYLKISSMQQQQILNFKFDDDVDSTLLPIVSFRVAHTYRDVPSTTSSLNSSRS
jgi:hypothetical protein